MHVTGHTDEPPPWVGPPRHLLPGTAPTTAVLARTHDTAVALITIRGYPTGLEITLAVRTRSAVPNLFGQVTNHDRHDDHLQWAITYPDGTTTAADYPDSPTDQPVLIPQHASGTDDAVDATYWLTPLPPAGTVRILCAWPAMEIAETTALDTEPLLDAAARATPLWDPEGP